MIDYSEQGIVWYAMKTTYKKELKAKEFLDSHGVENFVPMQQCVSTKYGRKSVTLKPAIHNLIFVKSDIKQLKDIKISLNYLHNQLSMQNGLLCPIVVPTKQMDQFINAQTHNIEDIDYLDLSTTVIKKGTPVRITDGKFKGYEGELDKVKGKRDRRVIVNIDGIVAYKFEVEACYIEKL